MQAKWGTHGDYEAVVLAPSSAQETYELTYKAFGISEFLRHPVILLSDEIVAHSRERVVISQDSVQPVERKYAKAGDLPYGSEDEKGHALMPRFGDGLDLLVTGSTHNRQGFRKTVDPEVHDDLVRRIAAKVLNRLDILTDVIISGPDQAEWGIVSYGCTSRSVDEIMLGGLNANTTRSLKVRTLWPFPENEIKEFSETVERLLVPELNLGQLSREIERVVGMDTEVVSLSRIGGGLMIEPHEIAERLQTI
ncbi:MAG: hypothetical protein ACXAEF_14825 [Candidatus Thorarchaeota archaeon]